MSLVHLNKKGNEIQDTAWFLPKKEAFAFIVRARTGVRLGRHLHHEIQRGKVVQVPDPSLCDPDSECCLKSEVPQGPGLALA